VKPSVHLKKLRQQQRYFQHQLEALETLDESERRGDWHEARDWSRRRVDELTRLIEKYEGNHETSNRIGG
jgi:hypothetical protein